jgi:hypothetical protein
LDREGGVGAFGEGLVFWREGVEVLVGYLGFAEWFGFSTAWNRCEGEVVPDERVPIGVWGLSSVASQTAWTEVFMTVRALALKPSGTLGRLA